MSEITAPKGEIAWVGYYNSKGEIRFMLTSKPSRDYYFMYEITENGALKKLGKAKEPPELESKYDVYLKLNNPHNNH